MLILINDVPISVKKRDEKSSFSAKTAPVSSTRLVSKDKHVQGKNTQLEALIRDVMLATPIFKHSLYHNLKSCMNIRYASVIY